MSIFLRHSHNVKPERYGSEADVQYSIAKNSEKIYGVDPDTNVLVMPGFWGFPCNDFSGKQNHGTPVGGVAYDGQGYSFDGVDDYVEVADANSLDMTTQFTLSSSIKQSALAVDKAILAKWNYNTQGCWELQTGRVANSEIYFFVASSLGDLGNNGGGTTDVNMVAGNLYDIVMVYNGSGATNADKVKIYVNGSLKTISFVGIIPASLQNSASSVKIGKFGGTLTRYFNGLIDEARINNITLTAEQIALFYARKWDLYRRVGRTYYSIAAAPSIYIPRIMIF